MNERVPDPRQLDSTTSLLVQSQYLHTLKQYQQLDQDLSEKYGMTYDEFIISPLSRQRKHSSEIASDSIDWQRALDGIKNIQRKLAQLKDIIPKDSAK